MKFIEQFKAARQVGTPLLTVETFDAKSTIDSILGSFSEKRRNEIPFIQWDCVRGLRPVDGSQRGLEVLADISGGAASLEATAVTIQALKFIAEIGNEDAIIFFSNSHREWTEKDFVQGVWNLREAFKSAGNMLIMLCNPGSTLPNELVNDILLLEEPLPTTDDIAKIIGATYEYAKQKAPKADVVKRATDALIGLPSFPAEQSTAMCLDTKTGELDISELWARKRKIVSQTPGLSVWQGTEQMSDIGGLASVKTFCERVVTGNDAPRTIIFMDEIEKAFAGTGTDMSGVKTELTGSMLTWMQDNEVEGMIFIGVPGVNKSGLAKALGNTYGIPVINFGLADMQNGIIGSSNQNLKAAQKTVNAISGGKILAIATCNSIHALPPELRRRFNLGIFFFDAPNATERADIWKIYRQKYNIPATEPNPKDDGLTGAEIKECCRKAYSLKMTLKESREYIVPVTQSAGDLIRQLRASANGKYLSASKQGVYSDTETASYAQPTVATGRKMRSEEN